jgi:hypothetical protein
MTDPATADARPTRAGLVGLLIGTGLAMIAALGPLVSAITITIGVETQVGEASGLPDARMLPAALEGVGAVALVFLLTRRPVGRLSAWCVWLIFVSLAAGMAAQGAHAVWYDEQYRRLELPWMVKLLVSFVPPVSGRHPAPDREDGRGRHPDGGPAARHARGGGRPEHCRGHRSREPARDVARRT